MRRTTACLLIMLILFLSPCLALAESITASDIPAPAKSATPAPTSAAPDELYISEALSNNDSVWALDFYDYVELYNGGDTELMLSDFYISRRSDDAYQCRLPKITIKPDSYVVLICDESDISFNLPKGGCTLTLTRKDGVLCDTVMLPPMEDEVWQAENGLTALPSPGFPNTTAGAEDYRASLIQTLVINEVVASNDTLMPVDDEYYDLIELYNMGDKPINLSDYYLSDKKKELTLYRLPNVTLEPQQYYVVYASGLGGAHANFKVSSNGETLYISTLDGTCIDALRVPELQPDISYGRSGSSLCYFDKPTIGGENPKGAPSIAPAPQASVPAGLFSEPFSVTLSAEGDIYYTLDGSRPTAESRRCDGTPIDITGSATLRAITLSATALPSDIVTFHYLFNAKKYELPILSISSAPGTVTGRNGIYEKWESKSREAPVNITLIENGEQRFSVDCGLKIHGQGSRALKKKSFQVRFRGRYGTSKLKYKLFDDTDVSEFNALVLRSGSEDCSRAFLRDEFLTSLTAETMPNVLRQAYRPVNLFIDGEYFGIYFIRERINDDFAASHLGGTDADIDMINGWKRTEHGSAEDWLDLLQYCRSNNLAQQESYEYVASRLSIEGFMDYYIARAYTGDRDYANIRHCRSAGGDGLWRIVNFDLDWGFGTQPACLSNMIGTVSNKSSLNTIMINALLENPIFKHNMLERLNMHLLTTFAPERVLGHLEAMVAQLRHDMRYDRARWGYSMENWEKHIDFLRNFVKSEDGDRVSTMVRNAKRAFGLNDEEMEYYFGELWTTAR